MKEAASEQNKFDHKDQQCINNRALTTGRGDDAVFPVCVCVCLKNHDTIAAVVLTQNGSLEGWTHTTLEYIHILSCYFWLLIKWMPFNHPKNSKLRKVLFCLFCLHIRLINLFFENSSNLRFHNANDKIYLREGKNCSEEENCSYIVSFHPIILAGISLMHVLKHHIYKMA